MQKLTWSRWFALALCLMLIAWSGTTWGAEEVAGGYLAGYEEVQRPAPVSGFATLAYLLSLLLVFAFVLGLAYLATKFLGRRFREKSVGSGRILLSLPLGPKQSVCALELAGKVLVVGVTENSVSFLTEITEPEEIEMLRRGSLLGPDWESNGMFTEELGALSSLAQKLPSLFGNKR